MINEQSVNSPMQPYNVDISVLMLFHARADHFSQVWAEVKKARPARLFLYQDGPRENSDDMKGIMACRELVKDENIDWQCEVHRLYQKKNYGCDPSGFMSQRWAFSLTDKCMVLEDDVVPSQSFFTFCKEMLDRYEHDERITMIAGFNTDEVSDLPNGYANTTYSPEESNIQTIPSVQGRATPSYFFTRVFSIWGWASWARVVNQWEGDYAFVKDQARFKELCAKVKREKIFTWMPKACTDHTLSGRAHFESIFWAYMFMHDGLAIMPRMNMINNIGLQGGTHYNVDLRLKPRCQRQTFTMQRYEIWPPYTHPAQVEDWPQYLDSYFCRMGLDRPLHKMAHSIEELFLHLRYGDINGIIKALKIRLSKIIGTYKAY